MVVPFYRLVVGHNPRLVNQHAREVLAVSASAISLLHGMQTGYLYLLLWALLSERIIDPDLLQSLTRGGMLLGTLIIALSLGAGTLTGTPHRLHLRLQNGAAGPVPRRSRPGYHRCGAGARLLPTASAVLLIAPGNCIGARRGRKPAF